MNNAALNNVATAQQPPGEGTATLSSEALSPTAAWTSPPKPAPPHPSPRLPRGPACPRVIPSILTTTLCVWGWGDAVLFYGCRN